MYQAQNNSPSFTICFIAVGSNQPSHAGSVTDTIRVALKLLNGGEIAIIRQSRLFSTPAFPPGSGPDFVNAAIMIRTRLTALAVLDRLHGIESEMGRTRTSRWEARALDLDLLSYGDTVMPDLATYDAWRQMPLAKQAKQAPDQLILPHPRLHERGFVLIPMLDIAPNWRHPVLGQTITDLVRALTPPALVGIRPLEGAIPTDQPDTANFQQ